MKKFLLSGISMASLFLSGFSFQESKQKKLTGLWDLESVESIATDNIITYPYGEKPSGRMMIDKDGNYMVEIYTTARKRIASGSKNTATPEENVMMVKGSNAHYGQVVIDANTNTIYFKAERAFFPNWEGEDLKSTFTYDNGVLKSYSSNTTFGSSKAIVSWRKRK